MTLKKHTVLLAPSAIEDIQDGINYYKNIDFLLGKKFLEALKTTFKELKNNPFYQIRYENVRVRTVKKFPYVLHFVVEENSVIIYGVRFSKMKEVKIEIGKKQVI